MLPFKVITSSKALSPNNSQLPRTGGQGFTGEPGDTVEHTATFPWPAQPCHGPLVPGPAGLFQPPASSAASARDIVARAPPCAQGPGCPRLPLLPSLTPCPPPAARRQPQGDAASPGCCPCLSAGPPHLLLQLVPRLQLQTQASRCPSQCPLDTPGAFVSTHPKENSSVPPACPAPRTPGPVVGGVIYLQSRQGSWACASTSLPDPITTRAPEWLGRGTLLHPQSEAGLIWDTHC